MLHLDDGALRRLLDEPQATLASTRAHYEACDVCRRHAAELMATAQSVKRAFDEAGEEAGHGELAPALARVRARPLSESALPAAPNDPVSAFGQGRSNRFGAPLIAAAAAAAVAFAFAFTPLGTYARGFLTIFQPQQFVPVAVSSRDRQSFRYLPPLSAYGTLREQRPTTVFVPSALQAAALAHMPLRLPTTLPASIPARIAYSVTSTGGATFTFSAAKAQMAAATAQRPLPAMPPGLDGSTLQVVVGPIVGVAYGGNPQRLHQIEERHGRAARQIDHETRGADFPTLVIVQAPTPRIVSTGASAREIQQYLLRQPGVPPGLAAQISAIGDPSTTLPIPVPVDRAFAQQVLVQGVRGLAVGDNTGVGAGVVWQRDGFIYGVAGELPESEVLAIANSLR